MPSIHLQADQELPAISVPTKITSLQSASQSASQTASQPSREIKHTASFLLYKPSVMVNEQPATLHQVVRLVANSEAIEVFASLEYRWKKGWSNVPSAVNGIMKNVFKFQRKCGSNHIANGCAKTAANCFVHCSTCLPNTMWSVTRLSGGRLFIRFLSHLVFHNSLLHITFTHLASPWISHESLFKLEDFFECPECKIISIIYRFLFCFVRTLAKKI